jgi:hypothetical protein
MPSSSLNSSSKLLNIDGPGYGSETDHPLVEDTAAHYSNTTDPQNELLARREKECLLLALASMWNPLTKSIPILISTLLGVGFFAEGKYKTMMDGLALFAAFTAAAHKALQCDEYQDECITMIKKYKILAYKYRTLREVSMDGNKLKDKLAAYEEELACVADATKLTIRIMTNATPHLTELSGFGYKTLERPRSVLASSCGAIGSGCV